MHQSNWLSILKVAMYNKVSEKKMSWQKIKSASKKLGYEIKKMPSRRYEYQNLYHVEAFKLAYPEYDYNFDFESFMPFE
jgi:hypothetical protein